MNPDPSPVVGGSVGTTEGDLIASESPVSSTDTVSKDGEAAQLEKLAVTRSIPKTSLHKFNSILGRYMHQIHKGKLQTVIYESTFVQTSVSLLLVPELMKIIESKLKKVVLKPGWNQISKPATDEALPFLDKFDLFPRLPPEIRTMIWKLVFQRPRIVKISLKQSEDDWQDEDDWQEAVGPDRFTTNTDSPITLQINKESRVETLKHFQLSFHHKLAKPTVYTDWSNDIICFGASHTEKSMSESRIIGHLSQQSINHSKFMKKVFLSDAGKIQRLSCSYAEILHLLEKPEFIGGCQDLKEIYVDLEAASRDVAHLDSCGFSVTPLPQYMVYLRVRDREHQKKMRKMKQPAWIEETDPAHLFKKILIDEVTSTFNKAIQKYPAWKAPNLRFGYLERMELQEKKARYEKDLLALQRL